MSIKPYFFTATFIVALAIFLNYPASPLSSRLQQWKHSGHLFKFKKLDIFYHDAQGTGEDGSVLVCIHGFPTSNFDFIKLWPNLQVIFGRVIAPDMIGFGFSDKPKGHNYTVFEQADMIKSLLDNLGINKFHILAHDLGDTVAQEMVARYEDGHTQFVIQSLTLLNGGILPETNFPKVVQKILLNDYTGPVISRFTNYLIFKQSLSDVFGEYTKPSEQDLEDFWSGVRWKDGYLATHGILKYINQRYVNRDRWVHVLQTTSIPLHLIYGPSDPINGPETFLKKFRQLVPKCSVEVLQEYISHYPHWEDSANVVKSLKNFIRSL